MRDGVNRVWVDCDEDFDRESLAGGGTTEAESGRSVSLTEYG